MQNIDPKKESQLSQAEDWLNNAIDPSTEQDEEPEQEQEEQEEEQEDG